MYESFAQIEADILGRNVKKTIALAGSHSRDALSAVVEARKRGFVSAGLIGDEEKTRSLLRELGESPDHYRIIHEPAGRAAAQLAGEMVHNGEADIPMKGALETKDFMRAILDKRFAFIPAGALLCHTAVLEHTAGKRLLIMSDGAVNIAPDYEAKLKILNAAVTLAHQLGNERPRVAVIAPVEMVNPSMPSTVDAAMLSKANQRGQIRGCVVDGPLALDNAIDEDAAKAKGIAGEVAGRADILIMPDLCAGNVFSKSLHYFAGIRQAGTVSGATIPIVLTSRTDTPENKYLSILIAVLQSL